VRLHVALVLDQSAALDCERSSGSKPLTASLPPEIWNVINPAGTAECEAVVAPVQRRGGSRMLSPTFESMSAQNLLARDVLSSSWGFIARPARCGRARFDQVEIASRAAGLSLTKSSSPDDNTSVNSARSTGAACSRADGPSSNCSYSGWRPCKSDFRRALQAAGGGIAASPDSAATVSDLAEAWRG
jgi:hypothetical protein